jgi:hypothetical protein
MAEKHQDGELLLGQFYDCDGVELFSQVLQLGIDSELFVAKKVLLDSLGHELVLLCI